MTTARVCVCVASAPFQLQVIDRPCLTNVLMQVIQWEKAVGRPRESKPTYKNGFSSSF